MMVLPVSAIAESNSRSYTHIDCHIVNVIIVVAQDETWIDTSVEEDEEHEEEEEDRERTRTVVTHTRLSSLLGKT